jgi:2-amino-4-hydroxy-6-hydroxymethyldihydropteridine diphosphokinase / dihydropteroate synthase
MADVIVGAGANLGDRLATLRRAVRSLRALAPAFRVARVSPVYESDALVPEGAPDDWRLPYLNLAVRGDWTGGAEELVRALKGIEAALGRPARARWAPREIDLDLLAFDGVRLDAPGLTLPHPDLAARPFALLPLVDVAPRWSWPPEADGRPGRTAGELVRPWLVSPEHVPFRTRRTALVLTELVGVVNLTPDSFSDGGRLAGPRAAIDHALALAEAGASVLDLGAESTRPGASPVTPDEEWRRLGPVLEALAARPHGPVLSVDTRHAATAERAVAAGARWVNDVTGAADPALVRSVVRGGADLVLMHSLTVPPRRDRVLPPDADPVATLLEWGAGRLAWLAGQGLPPERVVFDPGIGFGKTPDQTAALLRRAGRLGDLGVRVLVGHSRKSFLAGWYPEGHPAATDPVARDFESALLAGQLAGRGVDYVRVHEVDLARRALAATALTG